MADMTVTLCGVAMKNPVTVASGTFGSGREYDEFVDVSRLGAVTTKGVSLTPWEGNPVPRIAETPSGMMNAVGLQNPGIEEFLKTDIPFLRQKDTRIIVNVCGHSVQDYVGVVERLQDEPVDLLEINVSCPNIKEGGIAFGVDPKQLCYVTREVKKKAKQPIMMKLSPNVTDIKEMARAAVEGGADALSLINTLTGMKIDIHKRCFAVANRTGGVSGPAIRPIALRMVYDVCHTVDVPVVGMGGITDWEDAIAFIMAGATMVSVGTANFRDPFSTARIIAGIEQYMDREGISDLSEIRKCL
ncbi:MAG: dihydroorotate dehydrogenase [Eubacterium sp.]|nr:dihydroorotate dehydrogenase [Eubacterium sp.]MBR6171767.1 dihydroorotate dehydrogenase [Eubacterium sp.]